MKPKEMKAFLIALCIILLGASTTVGVFAKQANMPATATSPSLYLHIFNLGMGIGTNDSVGTYIPPSIFLSTRLPPDGIFKDTNAYWGGSPFSGRIEAHDGKYFLRLAGNVPSTSVYYSEIEPEKPFSPADHPKRDAVNYIMVFVLSTNSNYEPFLEKLRTDVARALAPRTPDPRFK